MGAMVAGVWQLVHGEDQLTLSGDFTAVAADGDADESAVHPLVARRPVASDRDADGHSLGRGGSSMLADARALVDGDTGPVAVPAVQLADGALAWASPRQLRIIGGAGDERATADLCATGIESQAWVAGRLVLAGCGRAIGVGGAGQVRWQRRSAHGGSIDLRRVGDRVVVAEVGARTLTALDPADGRVAWRAKVPGTLRRVRAIGADAVAVVAIDRTGTRLTVLDAATGDVRWRRRWDGWAETATAPSPRRIVLGLTDMVGNERCVRSGLVEVDAATGATIATRALDRRMFARDVQVDPGTSRPVMVMQGRSCSIALLNPRIDVTTARGLEVLHRVSLDERPCSGVSTRARLAVVATCSEVVAIDTLDGTVSWRHPLASLSTRESIAVSVTPDRVAVTDDVGSLTLLAAAADPAGE